LIRYPNERQVIGQPSKRKLTDGESAQQCNAAYSPRDFSIYGNMLGGNLSQTIALIGGVIIIRSEN